MTLKTPDRESDLLSTNEMRLVGYSSEISKTATLWLAVTDDCPLACPYCYVVDKNTHRHMTFDTARKAVSLFWDGSGFLPAEGLSLFFIGGEPFLEVDLIRDVCEWTIEEANRRGTPSSESLVWRITTNGVLMDKPSVRSFIRDHGERLRLVLSLDGPQDVHDNQRYFPDGRGSYNQIVNTLPFLRESVRQLSANITVSRPTLNRIYDSVTHLWDLKIPLERLSLAYGEEWTEDDAVIVSDQMIKLAEFVLDNDLEDDPFYRMIFFSDAIGTPLPPWANGNNCMAGRNYLGIDTDGTLYPCYMTLPFVMKNRSARPIGHIDKGIDLNLLRPYQALDRWSQSSPRCMDCEVSGGCLWCAAYNYDLSETGSIYEKALYSCQPHKAMAEANRYFRARRFKKYEASDE